MLSTMIHYVKGRVHTTTTRAYTSRCLYMVRKLKGTQAFDYITEETVDLLQHALNQRPRGHSWSNNCECTEAQEHVPELRKTLKGRAP